MRAHCRSLFYGGGLAAALVVSATVFAIGSDGSATELGPLVSEAQELVGLARRQIAALDARLTRPTQRTNSTEISSRSKIEGSSYEHSELKRTAMRLAEIGDEVRAETSQCSEDTRKIGQDFRSRTRKFSSSVSQISSSTSSDLAAMAISKVERDLDAIQRELQAVASVTGCAPEESPNEKGDEDEREGAGKTD